MVPLAVAPCGGEESEEDEEEDAEEDEEEDEEERELDDDDKSKGTGRTCQRDRAASPRST